MAQTTSAAVQAWIRELLKKTQEKEEERKKKSQEMQTKEDAVRQCKKEKDRIPNQDDMTPEASSSWITTEAEIELREMTTDHQTKESPDTIQQAKGTSQKIMTVRSKAGRMITLEHTDESGNTEKSDDKS